MINYYNSGLYKQPFFTKHTELALFDDEYLQDEIEYDVNLFAEHFNHKPQNGLSEQETCVFWQYLPKCSRYFEPLVFIEKIALECDLTPFILTADRLCLVAVSAVGGVFSPRLDAYQALADNTIDENSYLFSDFDYFESVIGKVLTKKVLLAIS